MPVSVQQHQEKTFLTHVSHCACPRSPPTHKANGKANCLRRREATQNCITSLLDGIRALRRRRGLVAHREEGGEREGRGRRDVEEGGECRAYSLGSHARKEEE
jgi:hypothetical protein